MLKTIREMSMKQQLCCFIEFIVTYFSPLLAVFIVPYMCIRKKDKIYRVTPIIGAAVALSFYVVSYLIYNI